MQFERYLFFSSSIDLYFCFFQEICDATLNFTINRISIFEFTFSDTSEAYSESCPISRVELFEEIVKGKKLYLRCLAKS